MGKIKLKIPPPHEKQRAFFEAEARFVAYGGARAGGKSFAMRVKFVLLCLRYPGIQTLLLRRTLPELMENHVNPLLTLLNGIAKYNRQEKVFRFPNGARLKLGYMSNEADVLQYQGQAYDVIGMEEATMFTEFQFNCLRESNRSSGMMNEPFSPRMYLTMNPGGVGHQWVKRLFIDRNYKENERPEDYVFIAARVYDNKVFMARDPDYVHQLEALPEKRRRAMLYGDWDVFEGAFFEEFKPSPDPKMCEEYGISVEDALIQHRFTHVIKPFDIPSNWKIFRSFDWGYGKPFSVGYHALSPGGVAYRCAEIYGWNGNPNEGCRMTNSQICETIVRFEREHPYLRGRKIQGFADPSCWTKNGGLSFAEEAENYGLWFEKGNNERIPGWLQIRERLLFDKDGKAMLYFFDTCKAIIRCMPLMMFDDHCTEDMNSDLEDHCLDELRYFASSKSIPSRQITPKNVPIYDPLNQFETNNTHYFGGRYDN